MKRLILVSVFSFLVGCSNLPPAIQDPPPLDISYSQAQGDSAHHKNAPVRWGGVIIDVQNEQTFSRIQILSYPLNSYGRPRLDKPYVGRFLVESPEFLDPAIYTKDAEITVAGTLKGLQERNVGNKTLQLPLLQSSVIYLWPVYAPSNFYGYPYYYGTAGFGYGYPYYGNYGSPFFWGGYYPPPRR